MSQQLINLPLPESTVPDFVNDPNIPMDRKRLMLDEYHRRMSQSQSQGNLPPMQNPQPQIIDVAPQSQPQPVMGNAGAQRQGIDWGGLLGTLGSYAAAAGSAYGSGANPSQGLLNAANATQAHTQNINQYKTMQPYYQQMGYDVNKLDPRRGGAGVASTPESMIQLQSLVDQRNMNNLYRQQMIEAMQQKQQGTQGGKVLTVGQLMMLSPEFKARMQGQYDFSGGQNVDLLNQQIPTSLLQGFMPAKKTNITYGGGLKSSKTSNAIIRHGGGTGGGSKNPSSSGGSKKLIF